MQHFEEIVKKLMPVNEENLDLSFPLVGAKLVHWDYYQGSTCIDNNFCMFFDNGIVVSFYFEDSEGQVSFYTGPVHSFKK